MAWPLTESGLRERPGAPPRAPRWKGRKAGERALRYIPQGLRTGELSYH